MLNNKSYKQILKSTGIVGGSQVITIIIGIVRTKIIAILIGPSGIGYTGILQNIIDLVRGFSGLGINFSGVKKIANSSNNHNELGKSIIILKKWALWTGILGMFLLIIFCIPLSKYSFGTSIEAKNIALISITILFTSISSSQIALLQGMREINKMAKASFLGALFGTLLTIPFYLIFGIKGVVPGIIMTAFGSYIISSWYVRKIKRINIIYNRIDIFKGGLDMAKLGFFITLSGFLSTLTLYFIRSFLLKKMNLDAVGSFQACWMISNLYLGIILNSMLADFFPRLSEVHFDNKSTNRLINEQLEITLLITSPLIAGIIVFSKQIIHLFYSKSFIVALPVLQWQIAGTFFVILSWPLGVLFLAKNKGIFSLLTDVFKSILFLSFIFLGWNFFGFVSLGIAFAISNLIGIGLIYLCTNSISKFKYSKVNLKYSLIFGILIHLCLLNNLVKFSSNQKIFNLILIMLVLYISYNRLSKIIDIKTLLNNKLYPFKLK